MELYRHTWRPVKGKITDNSWFGGDTPAPEIKDAVSYQIPVSGLPDTYETITAPEGFSYNAARIFARTYARGHVGAPTRETSITKMFQRIAEALGDTGVKSGYFDEAQKHLFVRRLMYLLGTQKFCFNSPVLFNFGVSETPQGSACFILSVEDTLTDIAQLLVDEVTVFSGGSGAGSNLSNIRSSKENISTSGKASGPVSFMRGYDAFAGGIKSGGRTRRAAKMVILNEDHPDVLSFIDTKANAEKMARDLCKQGRTTGFDDPWSANNAVPFQNANHSVRFSEQFMGKVVAGKPFQHALKDRFGNVIETVDGQALFNRVAEAAWLCGDPGVQFHDTINRAHMTPAEGPIRASNPCSEYMYLDNTSCNLGSFKLTAYTEPGSDRWDVEALRADVTFITLAMDLVVETSYYPTKKIAQKTAETRTLGIGFTDLGSVLLSRGLAYGSAAGQACAAYLMRTIHTTALHASLRLGEILGCAEPYLGDSANAQKNREATLQLIRKQTTPTNYEENPEAVDAWVAALNIDTFQGLRNTQLTVLAPTGTISFLMDADTTGIEPCISLVQHKTLVGGGELRLVNKWVPVAIRRLQPELTEAQVEETVAYISEHSSVKGAPHLSSEHYPVFQCALGVGEEALSWQSHIYMMAACQDHISGAISKTVNLPHDATVEDIRQVYIAAYLQELKAVAVYRDGCKVWQPVVPQKEKPVETPAPAPVPVTDAPMYTPIAAVPAIRGSMTYKLNFPDVKFHVTITDDETGRPREIFLNGHMFGQTISGMANTIAILSSMLLRTGVNPQKLIHALKGSFFAPNGFVPGYEGFVSSIADGMARTLEMHMQRHRPPSKELAFQTDAEKNPAPAHTTFQSVNSCGYCGAFTMVRTGSCQTCTTCGRTTGCG